VPLFALIVVPWFVLVQRRNPEFAQFFFLHEHVARYLTTVHERAEPWWYFMGLLLVAVSPVVGSLGRCRQALRDAAAASTEFQTEKFLLTWCAVVLVFFSLSGSKLAPYLLPIMAPLALLVAPGVAAHPRALRRAALTLFVSLCIIALGLLAYTWRRNGVVEWAAVAWTSAAVVSGFAAWRFASRHCLPLADASRWLALAAASIFGYQGLIMAYSSLPPKRSAKLLASEVIPLINESQTLYSVGQFRHTLVFYLGRTMEVFAYRGELDFGLLQAGATASSTDLPAFRRRWDLESNALAFVDPNVYAELAASGLPGRIVARDGRSVVVSRR
jgi:4-amino-4-deoxy-L-arabinose transferase-like glycosyltransferase